MAGLLAGCEQLQERMSQVLIMMCILVFLCIQMLTLEMFFFNASFSLAYAYLKIKIFIVHFKPELCRFLFDTTNKSFLFTGNPTCKCLFSYKRSWNMPLPSPIITGQRRDCTEGSCGPRPPSKAAWRADGPGDFPAAPTGAEPQTGSPSLTGGAHRSGTLSNPAEQKTHAETDEWEKTVSTTGLL